jgi:hypothetical protein
VVGLGGECFRAYPSPGESVTHRGTTLSGQYVTVAGVPDTLGGVAGPGGVCFRAYPSPGESITH